MLEQFYVTFIFNVYSEQSLLKYGRLYCENGGKIAQARTLISPVMSYSMSAMTRGVVCEMCTTYTFVHSHFANMKIINILYSSRWFGCT